MNGLLKICYGFVEDVWFAIWIRTRGPLKIIFHVLFFGGAAYLGKISMPSLGILFPLGHSLPAPVWAIIGGLLGGLIAWVSLTSESID